ncbi:hypothetical protein LJC21_02510, partial [Bacteroides sp. OttesenSCG-928-E20]|nr:hypothetical protein [Bacteroides sp. OttesenSCG-928-E20]
KPIITITSKGAAPVTGTYTLGAGQSPDYGTRLTITLPYDNKRSLTGTATVSSWTTGPTYEVEHNGYMVINSAESLKAFRDLVNDGNAEINAIQTGNIDLKGEKWEPIGINAVGKYFQGTYNGGGYTISGLNVDGGGNDEQGLFGYTEGAILTGINLKEPTVTGGNDVGALVGFAGIDTHINNCSVQGGTITGGSYVGGLVGYNAGTIVASYATGVTVEATNSTGQAGGLVGRNFDTIAFCYATAESVTGGADHIGALVGYNYNNGPIYSCYAITAAGQALVGSGSPIIPPVANCNSTSDTDAGNTVRAYTGNPITIKTGRYAVRTVDASIWERDEPQPGLIWK